MHARAGGDGPTGRTARAGERRFEVAHAGLCRRGHLHASRAVREAAVGHRGRLRHEAGAVGPKLQEGAGLLRAPPIAVGSATKRVHRLTLEYGKLARIAEFIAKVRKFPEEPVDNTNH